MEKTEIAIFDRTERLFGAGTMKRLAETKVIIFGVGGVGSWCAEGLIRSGIGHLTIVDSDRVAPSNINRQCMATVKTVGRVKVEALKEKLLEINPDADIVPIQKIYSAESADSFRLGSYDYIVDAVDSLKDKADLILRASAEKRPVFFSSMGAALKVDPTRVRTAEFWEVRGCPLGAALRKKLRRAGSFPEKKFICVYSDEVLPNMGEDRPESAMPLRAGESAEGDPLLSNHDWSTSKAVINGTTAPVTAVFGFTLSGLILKDAVNRRQ